MSLLQQNFLYSCEYNQQRGHEQFIAEHALGYIVSGQTHFHTSAGIQIYGEGVIGLIRRNQLAKTVKVPSADGKPFKSINIFLDQESLKKYSAEHGIYIQTP